MPVEIVEALEPEPQEIPAIDPIVLRWRIGMRSWEQCHYTPGVRVGLRRQETIPEAASREADFFKTTGYHVRILTVEDKP